MRGDRRVCSFAGRVFLFNMEDTLADQEVKAQMERYGSVMFVRKHPAVPFCREVYFHDVRAAQRAYNAVYPHSGGVPTISEVRSRLAGAADPVRVNSPILLARLQNAAARKEAGQSPVCSCRLSEPVCQTHAILGRESPRKCREQVTLRCKATKLCDSGVLSR